MDAELETSTPPLASAAAVDSEPPVAALAAGADGADGTARLPADIGMAGDRDNMTVGAAAGALTAAGALLLIDAWTAAEPPVDDAPSNESDAATLLPAARATEDAAPLATPAANGSGGGATLPAAAAATVRTAPRKPTPDLVFVVAPDNSELLAAAPPPADSVGTALIVAEAASRNPSLPPIVSGVNTSNEPTRDSPPVTPPTVRALVRAAADVESEPPPMSPLLPAARVTEAAAPLDAGAAPSNPSSPLLVSSAPVAG